MKKIIIAICLVFICSVSFADDPNGGLLAWWKMDGPHDANDPDMVWDYSGNEFHGTRGSGDKWKNGALWFRGAELPGNWGLSGVTFDTLVSESLFSNISDEITIMFWITSDGNYIPDDGYQYIFAARDTLDLYSHAPFFSRFYVANGTHFVTKTFGKTSFAWDLGTPENENYCHIHDLWTHIAITVNLSSEEFVVYSNGNPYLDPWVSGEFNLLPDINNFNIGAEIWWPWKGYMKDFRIYNYALSEAEVRNLSSVPEERALTINIDPNFLDANSLSPSLGQHKYYGTLPINLFAEDQIKQCPDVYQFDHWIGDVEDPNSPITKITLTENKEVTAIYLAKERVCGDLCHPILKGDLNKDCHINLEDFALYCENWLSCTAPECD